VPEESSWRDRFTGRGAKREAEASPLNPCERRRRAGGCPADWLFHIDTDELLYPTGEWSLAHAVAASSSTGLLHFPVREVAKTHPGYKLSAGYNFFRHEAWFHAGAKLAYTNGKGAARITCTTPNVQGWVGGGRSDLICSAGRMA